MRSKVQELFVIQNSTGAGNDYSKDRQFRKLNAQKDKIMIKVLRGGQQILVENTDIVVGDVMLLDTGDKVVADAIVIDSQVGAGAGAGLDQHGLGRRDRGWSRNQGQLTAGWECGVPCQQGHGKGLWKCCSPPPRYHGDT